uniref:Tudor domain-containing protein n=1 Tax=Ciona savignyi TaxID=51511 RepID=H2YNK5_CIOSA
MKAPPTTPTPWTAGMMCMAKYWEDNQYYQAKIMDIHPHQTTAVVHFIEYGNHEEVALTHLAPIQFVPLNPPLGDLSSYSGPIGGLEFIRGHQGPVKHPVYQHQRINR